MTRPKEILMTFTKTLLGESRAPMGLADCCLAETPKVGELQMNWLRSEDLKEEKNVTAPVAIIAVAKTLRPPLPNQQQTDDFLVIMNLKGHDYREGIDIVGAPSCPSW
jgi:hypothetical protein